jgi:thymidine kinase
MELICGCMFSGKSERLVERLTEARSRGLRVAAFKHASDDRYAESQIVTHNGRRIDARATGSAGAILDEAEGADCVVIDEAQFFGEPILEVCRTLVQAGKTVVVAGLDRDSWGLAFGPMPALEAMADEITRTQAVCSRCGKAAEFTQRLVAVEGQSMIGGPEAYEARCERCFEAPPIELRR